MAIEFDEMRAVFEQLPPEKRAQVLRYAQALVSPQTNDVIIPMQLPIAGVPGSSLRGITLSPTVVDEMMQAIDEECERIDPDES